MFWKKKKPAGRLCLGVDVKRCAECDGPQRPCLVNGKPATFHRWVEEDKGLLQLQCLMRDDDERLQRLQRLFLEEGVVASGCSLEKLRKIHALVEWPDGSVATVDVHLVQFIPQPGVGCV